MNVDIHTNGFRHKTSSRAQMSRTPAARRGRVLHRILLVGYFAVILSLSLFALSVVAPPPAYVTETDSQGTNWQGSRDAVNGDFVGIVQIDFASGARYDGMLLETGFSGPATYTGAEGWTLSGVFVTGYLEGEGSYQDTQGSFEGHFVRSLPDGKGLYRSTQGWYYEGDFKAGKVTGQGTLTFLDGSTVAGAFENGVFKG